MLSKNGFNVVGQATSLEEIFERYPSSGADVLILDLNLGASWGIDTLNKVINVYTELKVVVLSMWEHTSIVVEAHKAGALAYIFKSSSPEHLFTAINSAAIGVSYFPPGMYEKLAKFLLAKEGDNNSKRDPRLILNQVELDIFVLLAKGYSPQIIASNTGLNTRTVNNKITQIKRSLDIQTSQVTWTAIKHGLMPLDL